MAGWGRRFRIAIEGDDPRTGRRFIWHMFQARPGGGAFVRPATAGPAIGEWHSAGGIKFGSIEVAEVRFPLFFRASRIPRRLRRRRAYSAAASAACSTWWSRRRSRRSATPPATASAMARCGMLGGEDGAPHHYALVSASRRRACCAPRRSASRSCRAIALHSILWRRRLGQASGASQEARDRDRDRVSPEQANVGAGSDDVHDRHRCRRHLHGSGRYRPAGRRFSRSLRPRRPTSPSV